LELVTSNYNTGYPAFDVKKSFKSEDGNNYFLPPNGTGAQLWMHHHGGNTGKWIADIFTLGINAATPTSHIEGYFSVRAKTPGKNYIIPCGFLVGRNRCNKVGLQIRGTEGAQDERGNVSGHGVDPTGRVTDIVEFVSQVHYAESSGEQIHIEQTSTVKIIAKFNNEYLGMIHFIFENGDLS